LPFKLNHDRRHHVPRQRRKVVNWRDHEASLRQRGSLTVWFTLNPAVGLSRFGRFWREDNPRWLIKPGSAEAAGPVAGL
jgi:hypothetical protein